MHEQGEAKVIEVTTIITMKVFSYSVKLKMLLKFKRVVLAKFGEKTGFESISTADEHHEYKNYSQAYQLSHSHSSYGGGTD
jgi:hypothetical protein